VVGITACIAALTVLGTAGSTVSAPLPLEARLLQQGEFERVSVLPEPQRFGAAARWVRAERGFSSRVRDLQIARLEREGFVAALRAELRAWHGVNVVQPFKPYWAGSTAVLQFESASSATAEASAMLRDAKIVPPGTIPTARFAVPGIPGARGFTRYLGNGEETTLVFADGPFLNVIGFGTFTGARALTVPPYLGARMVAAARTLYQRVHGRPAS
jgi:hypothetical protein